MRVLVFGTFDGLHPGHRFVLSEALRRGDLFVVVARDGNVQKIKGKVPDRAESDRMRAVQDAFSTAHVILGDPQDFLVPVKSIRPDLILLGYDQRLPPGIAEGDLTCPTERLKPWKPELYKSSLLKKASPSDRSTSEGRTGSF